MGLPSLQLANSLQLAAGFSSVIPTKVGIQFFAVVWIPAYAGMTLEL